MSKSLKQYQQDEQRQRDAIKKLRAAIQSHKTTAGYRAKKEAALEKMITLKDQLLQALDGQKRLAGHIKTLKAFIAEAHALPADAADRKRKALRPGKRISKKTGKPYWESRQNRSDYDPKKKI
ncbi:hypothetical protein [Catalinimonas alkaloidigena]|nr:hypothetical protein [Catalinimonas alkaloidigena]